MGLHSLNGFSCAEKDLYECHIYPLKGTECPVQLNFADQNDKLTPPVVRDTPLPAFPDGRKVLLKWSLK